MNFVFQTREFVHVDSIPHKHVEQALTNENNLPPTQLLAVVFSLFLFENDDVVVSVQGWKECAENDERSNVRRLLQVTVKI